MPQLHPAVRQLARLALCSVLIHPLSAMAGCWSGGPTIPTLSPIAPTAADDAQLAAATGTSLLYPDCHPPLVRYTQPVDGGTYNHDVGIPIQFTAETNPDDRSGARMDDYQVQLNGQYLNTVKLSKSYSVNYSDYLRGVGAGRHALQLKVSDDGGRGGRAATKHSFTVNVLGPVTGQIDGVVVEGDQPYLTGWACDRNVAG
ncbi:hypothetical protein, partial [Chitinivorax sp. B]|uniref:hypothetical protein n=1 Tax=Chitinivorax sp. B TaxID=2502235 RepID=UPI0010F7A1C1